MSRKERGRKEVMFMAIYKIIRIYEVQAANRIDATNLMMEAIVLRVERDYHVADIVKAPGEPDEPGHTVSFDPPKGWLKLLAEQLLGITSE